MIHRRLLVLKGTIHWAVVNLYSMPFSHKFK